MFDSGLGKGEGRKYTLAVGEREEFSALDVFTTLPAAWSDTKFFFGDYATPAMAIAVALAAIGGIAYLAVRRNMGRGPGIKLK